jgi:hypothetical protein
MTGMAHFFCFDDDWRWYRDMKGGFFVLGHQENQRILVGVHTTEAADTMTLYNNLGDFDISPFKASFMINNRRTITKGTGHRDNKGSSNLFYVIECDSRNYVILFSIPKDFFSDTKDIQTFHEKDYIKDLFQNCFIF